MEKRDFSDGPVVKNPLCNAGDSGSILAQRTQIPRAVEQLSLYPAAREKPEHRDERPQATHEDPEGDSET